MMGSSLFPLFLWALMVAFSPPVDLTNVDKKHWKEQEGQIILWRFGTLIMAILMSWGKL